ncbi:MAG: ABC transporter ATP-binding protein [Clostridiales bacterium]|nr:ABC transporter ATP-binding protein [Clostridiales bacterium]
MIKLYRKILHKHLPIYIAGFWLLGLLSGAMQIFQIILVSEIVNKTIEQQGAVVKLFIPTCICFFSYILLKSVNDRLINASVNNVSKELRNQVGKKNNRMKLADLEEYGQGKIISIITNDIDDIGNWQKSLFLIGNTLTKFVGGIIFSVLMSWEITVILIPFATVSIFAPMLYLKDLDKYHVKEREKSNNMNGKLVDSIHFLNVIKTYCLEEYFKEDNKNILNQDGAIRKKIARKSELGYRMGVIIGHINTAVIMLSGVYLIIKGSIGVGELFGVIMIAGVFGEGINEFLIMMPNYQSGKVSIQRLLELLNKPDHRLESREDLEFDRNTDVVQVEHLTFGYDDKKILEDLSFSVARGEKIAIVGPSGCGKTTLFKLLCGMYELSEDEGSIRLMGKDLKDLALSDLASNMAVMPQDTYIFAGSIRENIVLNSDDPNHDRLEKCCEWLSLQDVIMKREDSYDVEISSVQSNMSKGQVQRIGLARVMYQNKEIMLLDEPTSALDHELSKKITDELLNMGNNVTLIIIAHKLQEPTMFDKIMVMDHGRLAGFAHHDLLIRECSIYQELIHSGLVENKG